MGVGFQQPLHLQLVFADEGDDPVGLVGAGASGGGVVIEHRVDNRALPAVGFVDDVAVGGRGGVEEGFNQGGHGGLFFGGKS